MQKLKLKEVFVKSQLELDIIVMNIYMMLQLMINVDISLLLTELDQMKSQLKKKDKPLLFSFSTV